MQNTLTSGYEFLIDASLEFIATWEREVILQKDFIKRRKSDPKWAGSVEVAQSNIMEISELIKMERTAVEKLRQKHFSILSRKTSFTNDEALTSTKTTEEKL